jgi:hypothetical protein
VVQVAADGLRGSLPLLDASPLKSRRPARVPAAEYSQRILAGDAMPGVIATKMHDERAVADQFGRRISSGTGFVPVFAAAQRPSIAT